MTHQTAPTTPRRTLGIRGLAVAALALASLPLAACTPAGTPALTAAPMTPYLVGGATASTGLRIVAPNDASVEAFVDDPQDCFIRDFHDRPLLLSCDSRAIGKKVTVTVQAAYDASYTNSTVKKFTVPVVAEDPAHPAKATPATIQADPVASPRLAGHVIPDPSPTTLKISILPVHDSKDLTVRLACSATHTHVHVYHRTPNLELDPQNPALSSDGGAYLTLHAPNPQAQTAPAYNPSGAVVGYGSAGVDADVACVDSASK